MDITALAAELTTDELLRGYAAMTDQEAADSLNDTIDRDRNRTTMTGREVAAEIDDAEYDALTDVKKAQILSLTSGDDIDPFGFGAFVTKDVFGVGSNTVAALAAARVETVSRADELSLGVVYAGHVENARM